MASFSSDRATDFYMNFISNAGCTDLPWYRVEISGSDVTELSTEKTAEGIILSSDNLDSVTIIATDHSTQKEIVISSNEDKVLITNSDEEPVVLEDTDGDGVFESEIIACTNHRYEDPVFSWANDFSCSATFTCTVCGFARIANCTVTCDTIPATGTMAEKFVYTATVTFSGKTYSDIREVPKSSVEIVQDYITLPAGKSAALQFRADSEVLLDLLRLTVEDDGDEPVITVDSDGTVHAVKPGTAYVVASVTVGDTTFTSRCRVDVTQRASAEETSGVQLGTSAVTTELYSTDYARFDVIALLQQNMPSIMAEADRRTVENTGVAVDSARFENEAADQHFKLVVKDDRTLLVVPRQSAIEKPSGVGKSYSSRVIVNVDGTEFVTQDKLTLTVKKTLPKLKAATLSFNSFFTDQSQPIVITGATVTSIERNQAKDTAKSSAIPKWLTLTDGVLTLAEGAPIKKTSGSAYVLVQTREWAVPFAVTVPVKVAYSAPSLKLSAASVTFANQGSGGVSLKLLCGKKNETPAGLNVAGIRAPEGFEVQNLDLTDGSFTLVPTGKITAGTKTLTVSFHNTGMTMALKLKVSTKSVTLTATPGSVTLNSVIGDSAVIRLTPAPQDYMMTPLTYRLTDSKGASTDQLDVTLSDRTVTVTTNSGTKQNATYKLYLSTAQSKEVAVNIKTLAEKSSKPSLSAKVTGAINLTFPETYALVTPSFRNHSGGQATLESWTVICTGTGDVTDLFALSEDNGKYRVSAAGDLSLGNNYQLSMTFSLSDGSTLSCSAKLSVKRTAVKLKLSSSSISLNKAIQDQGVVNVSCQTKGYTLSRPLITGAEELTVHYQGGKLTISTNELTRYGATYKLGIRATEADSPVTLTVKIPKEQASAVTAKLKAAGQIDAVRDSTSITMTPTYKNALRKPDGETIQIYSSEDQYKEPVTDLFRVESNGNGGFVITRAEGSQLNAKLKYRAVLTASFGEVTVTSAPVVLKLTMGSVKLTIDAPNPALYTVDKNSRASFRLQCADSALNSVVKVRFKNQTDGSLYELFDYGNGEFAIGFKGGEIDKRLAGKTTVSIQLEVFLDGNGTAAANNTITLKLRLVPTAQTK